MGDSKTAADVTDTPAGLDVVITEPGTIVGSKDLQGTDGTTRTDRPGEILGTPVVTDVHTAGQVKEAAKHDYVRSEVDRANREELPRLGGTVEDDWTPGNATSTPAAQAKANADAKAFGQSPAHGVTTASMAPAAPANSGIQVNKTVDKG